MATSKRAPRELDPFAKGKIANMHSDIGDAYRAVSLYEEAVREYEQALALCPTFVDIRTAAREHASRHGRPDGRDPRARTRARREPALRRRTAKLGLVYHAAARRDDAAAEWRAVLRCRSRRTARRRCTSRCSTRRAAPASKDAAC